MPCQATRPSAATRRPEVAATAFPPVPSRKFHRFLPVPSRQIHRFPPQLPAISGYIGHGRHCHSSDLDAMSSSNFPTLTYAEAEALCASHYPCPPGYGCPPGWRLSVGGVLVLPVPQGAARRLAITNHYYGELTPEQRLDTNWDPDNAATWSALFANRRERLLAMYDGDGPPPVNNNEEGRRLWWGARTLAGVMAYIMASDYPCLWYPHFQRKKGACGVLGSFCPARDATSRSDVGGSAGALAGVGGPSRIRRGGAPAEASRRPRRISEPACGHSRVARTDAAGGHLVAEGGGSLSCVRQRRRRRLQPLRAPVPKAMIALQRSFNVVRSWPANAAEAGARADRRRRRRLLR